MKSLNLYSRVQTSKNYILNEKKTNYFFLTEKHIQIMWLEQKYFDNLYTDCGKLIEIISPGIWNGEEGPDFKKAHILIDKKNYFGDIEIHLSDDGWKNHHHHLDSKYNHVILHLSFWKPLNIKDIITLNQKKVFQVYIESFLNIPIKKFVQSIDLDLYPYKKLSGTGKCSDEIFLKSSSNEIHSFFKDASKWRFGKKRERIRSRLSQSNEFFGAGIALALGYKKNSEFFLNLFIDSNKNNSSEDLFSYFLEKCDFFNETYQIKWQKSEYYCQLLKKKIGIKDQFKLHLNKIRPLNHPVRRLYYLAKLIESKKYLTLETSLYNFWKENWRTLKNKKEFLNFIKNLILMIPDFDDSYWNYHYNFEIKSSNKRLPLIGEPLKIEIIINNFLPYIDEIVEDSKEAERFESLFSFFKSQKTQKYWYLKHRFFGDSNKGAVLAKADILQGALQLHYDFCIHYESSCEGCPFIQRYKDAYYG